MCSYIYRYWIERTLEITKEPAVVFLTSMMDLWIGVFIMISWVISCFSESWADSYYRLWSVRRLCVAGRHEIRQGFLESNGLYSARRELKKVFWYDNEFNFKFTLRSENNFLVKIYRNCLVNTKFQFHQRA